MRRWALRIVLAVALLLVGGTGLVWWQANALVDELQAGSKRRVVEAVRPELDRDPRRPLVVTTAPPDAGAEREVRSSGPTIPEVDPEAKTILLVGSDRRHGQETNVHSDTIILLRIQPDERRIGVLSIPRDLLVEIDGLGRDRINEAFDRGGAGLLTRTVRETFGVRIDHFVEVSYHGFRQLVAELGGVYLPVDQRYFNRNLGTPGTNYAEIDLRPGYQRLNGRQALAFVRYRHHDSDLIRAARQQLFLRETARQVKESRADPLELRRLLRAFARATISDIDDVGELWGVVRAVQGTPSRRVFRYTVPVQDVELFGAAYLQASEAALARTVRAWAGQPPPAQEPQPEPAEPGPGPAPQQRSDPPPALPELASDGGAAARLLDPFADGLVACVPTALPPGFRWADDVPARAYRLAGERTLAAYATRGSGRSVLWTMSEWDGAPALADPTSTLRRGGRTYGLWFENRRLRQIAWQQGDVHVWITNTLRNELTTPQMLALAESCR